MKVKSVIPEVINTEKSECYKLYMAGLGPAEIVRRTGTKSDKLNAWIYRFKWKEQRTEIDAIRAQANPTMETPIARALVTDHDDSLKHRFLKTAQKIAVKDVEHWEKMEPEDRIGVAPALGTLNKMHRDNLGLSKEEEAASKGHISLTFLTNPHVKLINDQTTTIETK